MKYRCLIVLPLVLLLITFSEAQQLRLSLIGSISKEAGPEFEQFNWGFSAGGNIFFYLDDNFLLGVQALYSRWTPDESEFSESVNGIFEGNVSGDAYSIEIVPSIRLTTNYPMSAVNFFLQAGAGAFLINSDVTVSNEDTTAEVGEDTKVHFGFNAGAGLSFGNPQNISVDLFPMFSFVFMGENEYFRYFTINLAVGVGI